MGSSFDDLPMTGQLRFGLATLAGLLLLASLPGCAQPARLLILEEWGPLVLSDLGWEPPIAVPLTFRVLDAYDEMEPVADIEMTITTGSDGVLLSFGTEDLEPTRILKTWTDGRGQRTVFLSIYEMPVDLDTGEQQASSVLVDIGVDLMVVEIQP